MKPTPNAYNLIVEVPEDKLESLERTLQLLQDDLYMNKILPFGELKSIHFARFVILPKSIGRKKYPTQLAFSTNYDGTLDDHLKEILRCPNSNVDQIFLNCKGYNKFDERSKLKWFKQNGKLKAYFYRGTWLRETEQILFERNAREITEDYIDSIKPQHLSPDDLRKKIINHTKSIGAYKKFKPIKTPVLNVWQVIKIISLINYH